MKIEGTCSFCDRDVYVDLTEKETGEFYRYMRDGSLIQNVMQDTEPDVREFLRGIRIGMCYCSECQKLIMNGRSSGRIKYEEEEGR